VYQKAAAAADAVQMRVARGRGYLTEEERAAFADRDVEIEKMLTGLIRHLRTEDRQDRP
jgi:hypothetical protein